MRFSRQPEWPNIPSSVPISLWYLATILYTSVVDFLKFRRLVESPLYTTIVAECLYIDIL